MDKVNWNKVLYEEFKSSKELQDKASKQFDLKNHELENYHDPNDNQNRKYVYTGFEDTLETYDAQEPNIRLLKEICRTEYKDWKVKPRSKGKTSIAKNLTKLQISLLLAEIFGYRHYQTERIIGLSQKKIKEELEKAIKSVVKLGVGKCKTCKWRGKGTHEIKKDFCRFFKIKVRSGFYCWLHKEGTCSQK